MAENCWQLIDQAVTANNAKQVGVRRHLHRYPEISNAEKETTRYLAEMLYEAGLNPRRFDDGLGVAAEIDLGEVTANTKRIMLRADIDALPIHDDKTTEYRSCVPGVMHACGHDGHASVVMGAALAAASVRDSWRAADGPPLALRFVFQPAEENADGAARLIEQGVLDGITAALAVHMEPNYPVGHVGVRYGVLTATADEIQIAISGYAGHAARPHLTRDPMLAAAELITALYAILPRRVDSRSASVLTFGRLLAGTASNAIPDKASLYGTLRSVDPHTRDLLKERIAEICTGVATMTGTTVVPEFRQELPGVVNDDRLAAALEEASIAILGAEHITRIDQPSMGGEDFAFYLRHVPGAMLRLGCTTPGAEIHHLHTSRFDIDERALPIGSRILLRAAAAATRLIEVT